MNEMKNDLAAVRIDDLRDFVQLAKDYRDDLVKMRDDPFAWNEVVKKDNVALFEEDLAMTERLVKRYGAYLEEQEG